jgi:predicted ATPase
MRASKYLDHWGHVRKGVKYRVGFHNLTAINEDGGKKVNFPLAGSTVLCGGNGVGKTSLLKFLSANRTLQKGAPSFEGRIEWTCIGNNTKSAIYLNPSEEIGRLLDVGKYFHSDLEDFQDVLDSVDGATFSKKALEQINYVLSSSIESIKVYELPVSHELGGSELEEEGHAGVEEAIEEDGDLNDEVEEVYPYFCVIRNGRQSYSESLSHGEIYVIYFYWLLTVKITVPAAVLIDEPESFLSPFSQYRLADVFAYISDDRCIQFLLATHSPCFVEKHGVESALVATIDGAGFSLIRPGHESHCLYSLGYTVSKDKLVILEDVGAVRFFSNIFRALNLHWVRNRKLIPLKGESDITEILKRVPESVNIIGVYDGDQRGKVNKEINGHAVFILPGLFAPEIELISIIEKFPHEFSAQINMDPSIVSAVIVRLQGTDHHDYFGDLSENLQFDESVEHGMNKLFDHAFNLWFSKDGNRQAANELVASLDPNYVLVG